MVGDLKFDELRDRRMEKNLAYGHVERVDSSYLLYICLKFL